MPRFVTYKRTKCDQSKYNKNSMQIISSNAPVQDN